MALKAFSPAELKKEVNKSIDRKGLVEKLNQILLREAHRANSGIYVDTSVLDADKALLEELLPGWVVTSGSERNESFWVFTAKK